MLEIHVDEVELFDEGTETFFYIPSMKMKLEHSLKSISKWESKFKKPWLSKASKTDEEWAYYYYCMCINADDIDIGIFSILPKEYVNEIRAYLNDPLTATTIKEKHGSSGQFVSSELIYYWMTLYNIPFECDEWPINRLLTLISVCSEESQPKKKMSTKDILAQNRALSMARSMGR